MTAQVTPSGVRRLLESGIQPERVAQLLVATGDWSESGASDIVATLANEAHRVGPRVMAGAEVRLPVVGRASALARD
jgi:hypothetical protein